MAQLLMVVIRKIAANKKVARQYDKVDTAAFNELCRVAGIY